MIATSLVQLERALSDCADDIDAIFAACDQAAPNYGVEYGDFRLALREACTKYMYEGLNGRPPTPDDIRSFLAELQVHDLYLAMACASGNEHAWWTFDNTYRPYIERVARHLANAQVDAEEVTDSVYVELYGTRVVSGVRQSKFATYTGRGTLRGWLRTVVWHAVVDMYRARHDEISIETWTDAGGESQTRPGWQAESHGGEESMVDQLARERYSRTVSQALDASFSGLDDHEKLLLLYYHVENLKLREIARLVEEPASPLRRWFQRQSKRRAAEPESRVHESTVMRWLEKVYGKVAAGFRDQLTRHAGLNPSEVAICLELASTDLVANDVEHHLGHLSGEKLGKGP